MSRDLHKYKKTLTPLDRRISFLFIIGIGLIWAIYGLAQP